MIVTVDKPGMMENTRDAILCLVVPLRYHAGEPKKRELLAQHKALPPEA